MSTWLRGATICWFFQGSRKEPLVSYKLKFCTIMSIKNKWTSKCARALSKHSSNESDLHLLECKLKQGTLCILFPFCFNFLLNFNQTIQSRIIVPVQFPISVWLKLSTNRRYNWGAILLLPPLHPPIFTETLRRKAWCDYILVSSEQNVFDWTTLLKALTLRQGRDDSIRVKMCQRKVGPLMGGVSVSCLF